MRNEQTKIVKEALLSVGNVLHFVHETHPVAKSLDLMDSNTRCNDPMLMHQGCGSYYQMNLLQFKDHLKHLSQA